MKARFLRSGVTAEIRPIEYCPTCGGNRPAVDGLCVRCGQPTGPLSPLEHFMAARGVAAVIEATRDPGSRRGPGLPTPHPSEERTGAMSDPTEGTVQWRALQPGSVILRNPEHPHVTGRFVVIEATTNGWDVFIHYQSEGGCEGTFHVFQATFIAVAVSPNGGTAA